jgi:uridine kinase
MKFINIRGTSGSGKTTIIRELLSKSVHLEPVFTTGRKQPIMYIATVPSQEHFNFFCTKFFALLGHYETTCGGCDTIKSLDEVYEWARYAQRNYNIDAVICEGLLLGKDVSRIVTMEEPYILALDTSMEECYAGVKNRRLWKAIEKYGSEKDIPQEVMDKINGKPKALESDYKSIKSAVNRLRDKVTVIDVSRKTGLKEILELLS